MLLSNQAATQAYRLGDPARISGDAPPIEAHERSRVRAAAHYAKKVVPGAIGELIARELTAYADFGYRLNHDALIARLVQQVLTTAPPREPGTAREQPEANPRSATTRVLARRLDR